MHEIAPLLKETREKKKLKISEAVKKLKIKEHYIKALESGDLSEIAGEVYISGLLRSYANWLGLDGNELVKSLKSENQSSSSNNNNTAAVSSGRDNLRLPKSFMPSFGFSFRSSSSSANMVQPGLQVILISLLLTVIVYNLLYKGISKPPHVVPNSISEDYASVPEANFILLAKDRTELDVSDYRGAAVSRQTIEKGEAYFLSGDKYTVNSKNPDSVEVFEDAEDGRFLGTLSDNPVLQGKM